jgi:hypothetical protein
MDSWRDIPKLLEMGFPIERSSDLSLFSDSPRLIAAYHVFPRLLAPRHPPYALSSLTINLQTFQISDFRLQMGYHPKSAIGNLQLIDAVIPSSIFNCQRAVLNISDLGFQIEEPVSSV